MMVFLAGTSTWFTICNVFSLDITNILDVLSSLDFMVYIHQYAMRCKVNPLALLFLSGIIVLWLFSFIWDIEQEVSWLCFWLYDSDI
jgi:hypothetical protein